MRGTPAGNGVAGGTLPDKPEVAWTFSVEKHGFQTGAVISGGNVFVASTTGKLYSLDLSSGSKNWEYQSKSKFAASPAVRDGRVYIGDMDGVFHCVSASTGKQLWSFTPEDEIHSPANFYRDRVLFGSDDSSAYCLDAAGRLIWKFDMEDYVRCPATVSGNRGYFAGCSGELYVMDLDKGTMLAKVTYRCPNRLRGRARQETGPTSAPKTASFWRSISSRTLWPGDGGPRKPSVPRRP